MVFDVNIEWGDPLPNWRAKSRRIAAACDGLGSGGRNYAVDLQAITRARTKTVISFSSHCLNSRRADRRSSAMMSAAAHALDIGVVLSESAARLCARRCRPHQRTGPRKFHGHSK